MLLENYEGGCISTVLSGAAGIFNFERYISGRVKDEKRPSILLWPYCSPDMLDDLPQVAHEGREARPDGDALVALSGEDLGPTSMFKGCNLGLFLPQK